MHPYPPTRLAKALAFAAFLFVFALAAQAFSDDIVWRPITPEELQMTKPKVDPDADAEAIFWEVRLDDKNYSKLSYSHYVRVKIFTERGREKFAKMDIPFMKGKKVEKVAARVIRPDGTIIELKPGDIFEREIAKAGKARVLAKSFAVPGIEPGVIVEYQYSEILKEDSASGERLIFQRDIPMQRVSYYVRPYGNSKISFHSYNMDDTRFVDDKKGFQVGTMTNVPAFKEEPYMPPDDEVKKWVYLRYSDPLGTFLQWPSLSVRWQEGLKQLAKPNKEIKAKAAELTAGIASDEEKLRKIYNFIQKDMKNIAFDPSMTDEAIEKLKIKDADDAFRRGMGSSFHLDMLFASLAKAAGFDTNVILASDRGDIFFDREKYPFTNFVQMSGVAVKLSTGWRYFDPCSPYMPFGSLPWNRENVQAMIVGEEGYSWRTIPLSTYERSPVVRTAKLILSVDGTLQGSVRMEYDGHQAIARRRDQFRDSQAKREEILKDEIKARISTAEVSDLVIENFEDSSKPLVYSFKVKIPNYAQKAGKRLILQPGFFEYGNSAVFSASERIHSIYFPYPWAEKDSVEIKLPAGFALDNAETPLPVEDGQKIGSLKVTMGIDKVNNVLSYQRAFHFGGGPNVLFPASSYPVIKKMFDYFHEADSHSVSVREQAK